MVLCQMVSGEPPHAGLTQPQIIMGLVRGDLRPTWPPHTMPELQQVGTGRVPCMQRVRCCACCPWSL